MTLERKPVPESFAARLTPRELDAAKLLYARWSPTAIGQELTIDYPSNLLRRVYQEAGIEGGKGSAKQDLFIKAMDALFERESAVAVTVPFEIANEPVALAI